MTEPWGPAAVFHVEQASKRPRLHYFSYYLDAGMEAQRGASPASFAKIEYTKTALLAAGVDLRLVSTAIAKPGAGSLPREEREVGSHERHIYLPSRRFPSRLSFPVTQALMWLQIVRYLLTQVRRGDMVMAYHSPAYLRPFRVARRLKRFRLILEVNEVYATVWDQYASRRPSEEAFIREADAHLFVSSIAAGEFSGGKPYAVSHGTYALPERRAWPVEDGQTHAVYAGVVDHRRGAELAAQSALHLPADHVVNILGFGADDAVRRLRQVVAEVNAEAGREAVVFHGEKRGQDLTDFLHRCHVGLNTHRYEPSELEGARYCFPSKVSLYLTHGLPVVSSELEVVTESPLAEFVTFYRDDDPASVAAAVVEAVKRVGDMAEDRIPQSLIKKLDRDFHASLWRLLS